MPRQFPLYVRTSGDPVLLGFAVIPTGMAGLLFRAVRGAPAMEWRDRGN